MSAIVALSEADRTRLVRLLGLCGSDFDGERANAAAMADKLIRSLRLTWNDVIVGTTDAMPEPEPPPRQEPEDPLDNFPSWRDAARYALLYHDNLSPWEHAFPQRLGKFPRLSAKQRDVLRRLVAQALGTTE